MYSSHTNYSAHTLYYLLSRFTAGAERALVGNNFDECLSLMTNQNDCIWICSENKKRYTGLYKLFP